MADTPALTSRLGAEFLGTFWLVFGGCGSAILAAKFPGAIGNNVINLGIGFVGVSLAFGLTVLTMAYAVGHVSGGHFNPAVTIGLAVAKRFPWKDAPAYIVTQVIAASSAGGALYVIASRQPGFEAGGFATNGYGLLSPGKYTMTAALVVEIILTAFFLYVILGATDGRAPVGFAPIAIGLALTIIHLVSIPVTNTSVNPARSTGVVWYAETDALGQLWLFWVAPIIGAVIAGATYSLITGEKVSAQLEGEVRAAAR